MRPFIGPVVGVAAPLVRCILRSAPSDRFKRLFWRWVGDPLSRGSWTFTARMTYGFVLRGNTVEFLGRYVYYFGIWEPNLSTWITQQLSSGDTFVDIGANIGYYALLAARLVGPSGHVVAIEASPRTFRDLARNLSLNDARNVRSVNVAVSDREGELQLYEGPLGSSGKTSVLGQPGLACVGTIGARPLAAILSDAEIAGTRLFKIDVEGAEWFVINGFAPYLPQTRPDAEFVIEISPSRLELLQRSPDDILDLFGRAGFKAYRIANDYRSSSYVDRAPYQAPQRLAGRILEDTDIIFSRLDQATL
jgi:FkbM family methyltransferase